MVAIHHGSGNGLGSARAPHPSLGEAGSPTTGSAARLLGAFLTESGEQVCGIELIARGASFVCVQGPAIYVRDLVSWVARSFPRMVFCQEVFVRCTAIHFRLGGRSQGD